MSRHLEMSEPSPDEIVMQPRTFCWVASPPRSSSRHCRRRSWCSPARSRWHRTHISNRCRTRAASWLQPPSVWTLMTSLLSRVRDSDTWQRKYSDVLCCTAQATAGRGGELAGGEPAAAGNTLVVGELERLLGMRDRNRRQQRQRGQQGAILTAFIRIIPMICFCRIGSKWKWKDSRHGWDGKSQSHARGLMSRDDAAH